MVEDTFNQPKHFGKDGMSVNSWYTFLTLHPQHLCVFPYCVGHNRFRCAEIFVGFRHQEKCGRFVYFFQVFSAVFCLFTSRRVGWCFFSAVFCCSCHGVLASFVEGFCLFLSGLLSSVLLFVSRRCADLRTCLFISSSLLSSAMLFMSRQRAGCVVVAGVQVSFRHSVDVRIRPHVWLR